MSSSLKLASSGMHSAEFGVRRCISPLLIILVIVFTGAILYHATGPSAIPNMFVSIRWDTTQTSDHVQEVPKTTGKLRSSASPPQISQQPLLKPKYDQPEAAAQNSAVSKAPPPSGPNSWPLEVLMTGEKERLQQVLRGAAMDDKTVIVATLNAAWSVPGSIFDLFLESFKIGNGTKNILHHLVIFNFDPIAYARCKSIHHPYCFALITDGIDFSDSQFFMSPGYLNLVWRKLDVLRMVLQQGYNLVSTDIDILWLRDPFPHFNPDADFQISCDYCFDDPTNLNNYPNGGFIYVRANTRTTKFFDYWYNSRLKIPGKGQQGVFNAIKRDNFTRDTGVKIWFLSFDYFGGFCQPAKDLSKVCTMHTNCCVGLDRKVHDLRIMLDDWNKYLRLTPQKRETGQYTWSFLQLRCG